MYRVKGARGVKHALQALLGAVIANPADFVAVKEKDAAILERLGKLIDSLDRFTSRVMKLKRIFQKPVMAALDYIGKAIDADSSEDQQAE